MGAEGGTDRAEAPAAQFEAQIPDLKNKIERVVANRRHANSMFDPARRIAIETLARAEGVPLFLDAVRIFIEAEWTDRTPAEIAAPYDFVYVSLYKYLTAPFGAVLLGPADKLEGLFHDRRRYGGGLWQMWPAALLALDALGRQDAEWRQSRLAGEAVFAALETHGLEIERFAFGSNGVAMHVGDDASLTSRAREAGLKLAPIGHGKLILKTNFTWTQDDLESIARRLSDVLGAASG